MTYEQIPAELRKLKRWGLFHKEWVEARHKYTKIPVDPFTGEGGKSNDESTWADFDTALAVLTTEKSVDGHKVDLHGLAFYFKPPYVGIDIDHVKDEIDDYVHGDNSNIVADFMQVQSYAETSISGEGVHIITKGTIPGDKRRHGNVEMYQSGRFFALTGDAFGTHTDVVTDADPKVLKEVYTKYIEPQPLKPAVQHSNVPTVNVNDLTEQEVVEAMMQSKGAPRIRSLLQGKWDGLYGSQSEADIALANDLAFWTAKDFTKMDAIFRQSGLMRPKWDERHGKTSYGVATLNKAIADTAETYHPKQNNDFWLDVPGLTTPENPKTIVWRSYDDTGLAERFKDEFGKRAKYDTTNRKFMYFDGIKWNYDEHFVVSRMLNNIVENLKSEPIHASEGVSEDDKKAADEARSKFVKRSRSNAGKNAAENEIKKLIPAVPNDFDATLGVINTPSGYVNLTSGEITTTKPDDLFTKSTMAEYSPTAEAPRWEEFLNTVMCGDDVLIKFVQRLVGYSLLGTNEQSVMVITHGEKSHGNGSNGKSVFNETLRTILGDYAASIDPETVMVKRYGMDSKSMAQIASLKGARMAITSETEQGQRLDEALVKRMTGGEEMTGKNLYAQPFNFKPTHVLWMSTNNKPIIRGTDDGIWRRLLFIPFKAVIDEQHKDPLLKEKLLTEASGILNWAVDGALEYQQTHKLNVPEEVRLQNTEYRGEMDTVGMFLDECAELRSSARTSNAEISKAFQAWEKINQSGMSVAGLRRELGNRFERYRTKGIRGFIGLAVKDDKKGDSFDF